MNDLAMKLIFIEEESFFDNGRKRMGDWKIVTFR